MTTKEFVRGFIVTMALCLTATAGRAQSDRIFLLGAGSSLNDNRTFTEAFQNYSTSYAKGGRGIVGVELPLKKSKTFGLEVSYGYGQNNLKLANLQYSYTPVTAYGLKDNRVSGDIVARAPKVYHGVRPYVVFGAEYNDFAPAGSAQTTATKVGFAYATAGVKFSSQGSGGVNFGGGFDHKVTSKVDLRIDVRDHLTGSPTFGLPTTEPSTAGLAWFPATGRARNIEYSIGIVYRFGREKPSTAPSESTKPTKAPRPRSSPQPSSPKMPSSPPSPL